MSPARHLRGKSLFLFDLDGVFYRGKEDRVKIGGTKAIRSLRRKGVAFFVLTNNSTDSVETLRSRLEDFQVPVKKEEILTSAMLTAEYLLERHGRVRYFLVGEGGLQDEMDARGHRRASPSNDPRFVVVGLDRSLTYEKLNTATTILRAGASLVATHSARLYMYKSGPAMAAGPIVKALEYSSGKRATVIGKPSPLMFRMALRRAGAKPEEAVMIGDQVDTDLVGAARAGIDAVLVKTGVDKSPGDSKVLATLDNVDDISSLI